MTRELVWLTKDPIKSTIKNNVNFMGLIASPTTITMILCVTTKLSFYHSKNDIYIRMETRSQNFKKLHKFSKIYKLVVFNTIMQNPLVLIFIIIMKLVNFQYWKYRGLGIKLPSSISVYITNYAVSTSSKLVCSKTIWSEMKSTTLSINVHGWRNRFGT